MSHKTHLIRHDKTHLIRHETIQLQVSFAKEPYKRDDILQKRPVIFYHHKTHLIRHETCHLNSTHYITSNPHAHVTLPVYIRVT